MNVSSFEKGTKRASRKEPFSRLGMESLCFYLSGTCWKEEKRSASFLFSLPLFYSFALQFCLVLPYRFSFFLCFYPGCSPDSRIPYTFFFFSDPVLPYLDSLRRSLFGLVRVTEETLLWHPKREMQELGPSGSRYSVK